MNSDEKSLIEGISSGNPLAFQDLYSKYYPLLVTYSYKILKDLDLSREVSQTVIVRLYEKRDQLSINSSVKAYLISSVHREAVLMHKKQTRQANLVEMASSNTEDLLEQAESELRIWNTIDELPDKCREIFVQNRFEGKSNQEIADMLNISKRTVETQISKALKILRQKLLSWFFKKIYTRRTCFSG